MIISPAIEKDPLYLALYTGDRQALAGLLADNPDCLHGLEHNPYVYLVDSAKLRKESEEAAKELIEFIHPHTTPNQRRKGLRAAAEKAGHASWLDLSMWALGEGAKLSDNLGDIVLSYIWAKPEEFEFSKVAAWRDTQNFEQPEWAHKALFTLALVGTKPADLDQYADYLKGHFSPELLKEALARSIGMMVLDRAMGREGPLRATPQSMGWLDRKMEEGLREELQKLGPEFAIEVPQLLNMLDRADLDETTQETQGMRKTARF